MIAIDLAFGVVLLLSKQVPRHIEVLVTLAFILDHAKVLAHERHDLFKLLVTRYLRPLTIRIQTLHKLHHQVFVIGWWAKYRILSGSFIHVELIGGRVIQGR